MRAFFQPLRASRGSVLVVLLVTLLFASLLLTRLVEAGGSDLLIAMRVADRERLRGDAHAALETVLAVLADFQAIDRGLHVPEQGWADPFSYAGYAPREGVSVEASFEDESAKLSLPALRPDQLTALLGHLGLKTDEAARVADALLAWMRNNHPAAGPEADASAYARSDPAFAPPQRSLRTFDEIAGINVAREYFFDAGGRPTPLLGGFARVVSLYRFSGANLNAADPLVLHATGWDQAQIDAVQKYRTTTNLATKAPPYFRSTWEARRQMGGNVALDGLGAAISCLRVNLTVREGAAVMRLSALVSPGGRAWMPASIAANPTALTGGRLAGSGPAATAGAAPASNPARAQAGANAKNALRYPFTVLELTESTPPPETSS